MKSTWVPVLLAGAVLFALVACGDDNPRTREVIVTDLWAICVDPVDGSNTLADGTEVTVRVEMGTCLSSSCDTLTGSSCELVPEGSGGTVEAEATIESQVRGSCTADCGLVQTGCGTVTLTPGEWTFTGEGADLTFSVPGDVPDCQFQAP